MFSQTATSDNPALCLLLGGNRRIPTFRHNSGSSLAQSIIPLLIRSRVTLYCSMISSVLEIHGFKRRLPHVSVCLETHTSLRRSNTLSADHSSIANGAPCSRIQRTLRARTSGLEARWGFGFLLNCRRQLTRGLIFYLRPTRECVAAETFPTGQPYCKGGRNLLVRGYACDFRFCSH